MCTIKGRSKSRYMILIKKRKKFSKGINLGYDSAVRVWQHFEEF